jgi:hypothetical protein
MLPSATSLLPILLLSLSLFPSTTAQGFNNFQQTSSTTTSTSKSSTHTSTSTTASATSTGAYGTCVDTCLTTYPPVNHCKGTETDKALEVCKCQSYTPSNDPLINCVLNCPSEQQYAFADSLPKLCAQTLFLGLNLTDTPKANAVNTAASATFNAAEATGSSTASGNHGVRFGAKAGVAGLGTLALGVAIFL